MAFTIRPEHLRDPLNSEEILVRHEDAFDCDGIDCGTAVGNDLGAPVSYVSHDRHMIVSGRNPLASERCIAISK